MMTADDWNDEIIRRYRAAAKVTAEARAFHKRAGAIVDRMRAEEAADIVALFADVPGLVDGYFNAETEVR